MKKISVKAVSILLAASVMTSLAACRKEESNIRNDGSNSGQKITSDTPWYNSNVIEVKAGIDPGRKIEYANSRAVGADDKNVIVYTGGLYKTPDDNNVDWENLDYSDYMLATISVVDRKTGATVKDMDLVPVIGNEGHVDSARYENGQVIAMVSSYNTATFEQTYKELTIDPFSGKLIDSKDLSGNESGDIYHSFTIGNYRVDTEIDWSGRTASYFLHITKPDGETRTVELKDDTSDLYDIPVIISKNDTSALLSVTSDKGYVYYGLDLETGNITKEDAKDYEWLDIERCYSPFTGKDGSIFFAEPTGISRIDFANKTCGLVFNYSWSNINRSLLENMDIIDVSEDSFLLCGDIYRKNPYSLSENSTFTIIDFTRADKNPNAGKQILELFSLYGYTDDKISDAILKFNETNGKYFIEVTDRYSQFDYADYSDLNSDDDFQKAELNADAAMSSQLAIDILNGQGPDILMNCSSYGQLNNDSYLVDLTSHIGSLDPDKYFTNVVDSAKVDGKLYNLPLCYEVDGIHTDAANAGKSGVGFTTEEYEQFLYNTLNGKDVITLGQAYYFVKLYNAMSDKFVADGKIDFSSPEFETIARFVKDNVPENAKAWDDYEDSYDYSMAPEPNVMKGDMPLNSTLVAGYISCYGMINYLQNIYIYSGGTAVLGIPSSDGRGPLVTPYLSVAVSAQARNVDACCDFVKLLLSDEVQLDLAMKDNFVLSREAFRAGGKAAVEFYNGEGYDYYIGFDFGPDRKIPFSDKTVDDMENIVLSCSNCNSVDAQINIILIEEMPAYFTGQKELSEVVAIAQDRAQKVLDERG